MTIQIDIICPHCGAAFPIDADTIHLVRDHVSDCGDADDLE